MQSLLKVFTWPFDSNNGALVAGASFWMAVVGFGLTWLGLKLAYRQIQKTQSAVQAAQSAVDGVRFRVRQYEATHELSKAKQSLDHFRDHIDEGKWKKASGSLEEARRSIIYLANSSDLSEDLLGKVNTMLKRINTTSKQVDLAWTGDGTEPDKAKTMDQIRSHFSLLASIEKELYERFFR